MLNYQYISVTIPAVELSEMRRTMDNLNAQAKCIDEERSSAFKSHLQLYEGYVNDLMGLLPKQDCEQLTASIINGPIKMIHQLHQSGLGK